MTDMSYGPNSNLILEIIDFAERGPLLRPTGPVGGDRVHLIDDFDEAMEYAYHHEISEAEDAPNWKELREREARKHHRAYQDPALTPVSKAVQAWWESVLDTLPARLPEPYEDIDNDVLGDFLNIALSRGAFGADDRLFDRIWDAYRQGGWPCGWEGDYPEGQLVVYQPPA